MKLWWALVEHEVIGPFDTIDEWYHEHAGPDWRARLILAGQPDPWRVARTELGDGRCVSTVFLGLDHSWWPDRPPLLFETAVVPEYEIIARCWTWDQAVELHEAAVQQLVEVQT